MQNRLVNSFLILLSTILVSTFSGCGASSPTPTQKKTPPPSWITSVLPNDTDTKMFGMAVEKNREAAINAALSDMVSRLGTTIESSFHSEQKVTNSYSSLVTKSSIKADIAKIKVNNYKVIKSYKVSYREFAVMIETDKKKFLTGLKSEFKLQVDSIKQKSKALKSRDILTRYNGKKALAIDAQKLTSIVLMIAQLDRTFDKQAKLDYISLQQDAFLAEAQKLKFYVSYDAKSIAFADKIKNYLAKKGFNVVNSKQNAVEIKLSTDENINEGSIRIAVLILKVSVFDNASRIGGKRIIMKERYNDSLPSVYKNAAIHLEQDIQSDGINELIGINLDI